jgi:hypothetical protein
MTAQVRIGAHTWGMKLLTALIALALLASAAGATTHALLNVSTTNPVTIIGAQFQSAENVRVTVAAAGERRIRTTVASGAGTFKVRFVGLTASGPCKVSAVAVGAKGSRAVWKPTLMLCGADLQPG